MKFSAALLSLLAAAACGVAQAANGNVDLLSGPIASMPDLQPTESATLWDRFHVAFDQRSDEVFADRLHPLKVMEISLRRPADTWEQWVEHNNRAVKTAFAKSFEYSLRDASFGLPLIGWLQTRQDFLGGFLADSVDSVEEEAVSPFALSTGQAERNWWNKLAQRNTYHFGLRPFGSSPYAFLAMQLREAGQTILLGNVRYYLQNFADHRFELSVSLPLPAGLAFDLGTFYQFGPHNEQRRLVAKIFKPLSHGGIAHLGVEVRPDPVVFAGVSFLL